MCVRGLHNRHKDKKDLKAYLRYGIKHAYLSCQGIWALNVYDDAKKQNRDRLIDTDNVDSYGVGGESGRTE